MPDPTSADPDEIRVPDVIFWTLSNPGHSTDGQARVSAPRAQWEQLQAELDALRAQLPTGDLFEAWEAINVDRDTLRARLVQTEAVVEAARADLEHDCVASPTCIEFANRPGEYSCNERDRLVLGVINALAALPEAPPVAAGKEIVEWARSAENPPPPLPPVAAGEKT